MPTNARTSFWHPFSNMGAVSQQELLIERGEGVWVWDSEGKRYLDGTASLWCVNIGHGRTEVADAVAAQMRKLESFQAFGDFSNRPANELAERLSELSPMPDTKIFFGSGGGDAIDTASKIARRYMLECGHPERVHLISRQHGYHGTHGFGTSIGGIEPNIVGWGELVPDTSFVAHDSVEALEAEIKRLGADRVAAFFCEPVIGAGGVYPPEPGYLEGVAEVCRRHGVLLIIDSVICAFGRVGTWFGVERWNIQPDMITFAKGVTSGYLPLGGVAVSGEIAEPFFASDSKLTFRHGPTYAGHPACCVAGLAVIDIYEKDNLIERGQTLEGPLAAVLAQFKDHPAVAEVRGLGLLGAVELKQEVLDDPGSIGRFVEGGRHAGVILRSLLRGIAVSPPLTVEQEHLDLLGEGVAAGLALVEGAAQDQTKFR